MTSDYFNQRSTRISFSNSSWTVLSTIEKSIKEKIERIGKPLKEWDVNIYRGILTGYNEAFIIDQQTRDKLVAASPKSAEIIRPILRGRDIKRYKAEWAELYIINTHTGYKSKSGKFVPPVNVEEYPAVKEYLNQFYTQLSIRQDKGITPYHLRSCIYMEEFYKQKIVWAEIARTGNAFTLDLDGYMVSNTGYILSENNNELAETTYKNLLTFLNSKAILFYLDIISTRLDETGWRWLRQYVELLPIPKLTVSQLEKINITIINELTETTAIGQNKLNDFVNNIFDFNEDEVLYLNKLN